MKAGPSHIVIGTASCPLCHDRGLEIKTNKRGYPGAYCFACEHQFQPRDEKSSLLLLGHVHTWHENQRAAVEGMLSADDVAAFRPTLTALPPTLPPHLRAKQPAPSPAPKPKRTSLWDIKLV